MFKIIEGQNEPLPEYEEGLITRVLGKIDNQKESLMRGLNDLYNKTIDKDVLILVARQGVPIGYGLKAIYDERGRKMPKLSIINTSSVSRNETLNMQPIIIEDQQQMFEEILQSRFPGRKAFIDEVSANGNARKRLLTLAKELDPLSNYEFLTLYPQISDPQNIAPWDLSVESINGNPDEAMFISASAFLSLRQAKRYLGITDETNIMVPVSNPNKKSQEMSRRINSKLYEIGKEASKS